MKFTDCKSYIYRLVHSVILFTPAPASTRRPARGVGECGEGGRARDVLFERRQATAEAALTGQMGQHNALQKQTHVGVTRAK